MKTLVIFAALGGLQLAAQDMKSCPMHQQSKSEHQADVERHSDQAMGFPHDQTTHHFRLLPDGGAIEITVNDAKDVENLEAIRSHLKHIVMMFSNGDFSIPMLVHSEVPPGATEMKDRRANITYAVEEMPTGGRVRITTTNHDALNAVHDFLSFQIADHRMGDTTQP